MSLIDTTSDETLATVESIVLNGRHGPYAVAKVRVTFSLAGLNVGPEMQMLVPGRKIVISDIFKKKEGWKAGEARLLRPEEDKKALSIGETIARIEQIAEGTEDPHIVAMVWITFSLDKNTWPEEKHPERSSGVMLSDIFKRRLGWKAGKARLLRPENEK